MHKAVFWDYTVDERGAWLKCHLPGESIDDKFLAQVMHGEIRVDDGRRISSDQRKKIYALIKDIANHTGHHPEYLKEHMKYEFLVKEDREYFSLSNVDMTTARYFIEYILEFCFEWEVPLSANTVDLSRDINNYLYLCLAHRKCAICGEKADIHHHSNLDMTTARYFIEYILEFCFEWEVPLSANTVDLSRDINNYLYLCLAHRKCAICGEKADIHHHSNLVGMGRDRNRHDHHNSEFIALCRTHHTECHQIGLKQFEQKYHLKAIKLDLETIKELGI